MRNSFLAVVAMLGVAGCGGNGNTNPMGDGGIHLDQGTSLDLTSTGDMTMNANAGPGCFAILGGASATKSPARSKNLVNAFLMCADNACGNPSLMDGGINLPCSGASDAGSMSTQCNNCFANIQVNSQIQFVDMNMNPIMCVNVDTGAMDPNGLGCSGGMGACGTEIVNCVLDCNSDKDCAGLTTSAGPAHCDLTSNQCG